MKKNNKKNKKSKKHKKDKDINVSNKINIKIDTGSKRNKTNKTKSLPEKLKQYPQYPQYPTYTQYSPAPPVQPIPELDYNTLARRYLQEEPRPVREHLLLEDARPERGERAPLKRKISGVKINTPKKLLGGIKKISKNERVVELNKESLMKVKTLRELKDIFIQNGAPAERVKLLTRESDRGRAVDEFIKYLSYRDNPRTAAGGAGGAVSKGTPDIKKREMKMLSSVKAFHGGKSPPLRGTNLFPSQEAQTGKVEQMKSGTPITGNLYDVLREENSDSDSDKDIYPELSRDDPLNREFLRLQRERTALIIATARKKLEGKEPMRPLQSQPPQVSVAGGRGIPRGGPILGPPGRGRGRAPGRPPIQPTSTLNLQELGNYRPFQSQEATTPAGGAVPRDQTSISGNFYNALNIDD